MEKEKKEERLKRLQQLKFRQVNDSDLRNFNT